MIGVLVAVQSVFLSYTKVVSVEKNPYLITITTDDFADKDVLTLDEVLDKHLDVFIGRQSSPGTFVTLRSRGVPSSAHMQILYDGIPLGAANASFIDLSALPLMPYKLEFVKGGNSYAAGPNAIGGSLNLIPVEPEYETVNAYYTDSSYKTNSAGFILSTRKLLGSSAVFSYSKNTSGGYMENTEFNQNNFYTKFRIKNIEASLTSNETTSGAPAAMENAIPVEEWNKDVERKAYDKTGYARNRWEIYKISGEYGNVKLLLNHSGHNYLAFDGVFNSTTTTLETQTGAEIRFDFDDTGVGASIYGNSFDSGFKSTTSLITFFAEKKYKNFFGSVRGDKHSTFGQFISYRFEFNLEPVYNSRFYINTSRNFRAPSFYELYGFGGNSELKPEDSISYNFGIDSVFGLNFFYTELNNRIDFTTKYENKARAFQRGVEVSFMRDFGINRLKVLYTYLNAFNEVDGAFKTARLTPEQILNINHKLDFGRIFFNNDMKYVSEMYLDNDKKGLVFPSYFLWDMSIGLRISQARLLFGAENILDKKYATTFGFGATTTLMPQLPRTFFFKASIDFKG